VLSWPRLTLISGLFLVILTISCGVRGTPVNPSGPWGPDEGSASTHDNGRIDAENKVEPIDSL